MSDVFKEIDEEVRQDELKALWDRWGILFVVSVVSIILGWTGWIVWRDSVETARAEESAAFEAAVLAPGGEGLGALDELVATAAPGYAAIASFHKAGLLLEQGRPEDAVSAYGSIAGDDAANRRLQGLASLMAAMVLADLNLADEARGRLELLAIDGGDWALSAREMLALLDFRAGDLDAAESAFSVLSADTRTPPSMRQRSREMLELIDSRRAPEAATAATPEAATAVTPEPPAAPQEEEDAS